ncbi:MAG: DUF1579 domain-containing protein [bacterium]|nr:DUF1579 domain-containing protein [bacterium]
MRHIKLVVAFLAIVLAVGVTFSAAEGDKLSHEEINKRWMAYATPGSGHKHLEYFVGSWKGAAKMWMEPKAKPMEMAQMATGKMIMGGRYLETTIKSSFMNMPFEGRQVTGYDNMKKKYLTHWIDNMGTGFYPSSGGLDKAGKTRSEAGTWGCPISGGDLKVRIVTKIVDKNTFIMEMYSSGGMHGPAEFKTMETVYSRQN